MLHSFHPSMAALALTALLTSTMPAAAADMATRFDAAMQAYERNHWTEAFAALATLGDEGHIEAARIALQMWRYAEPLYRTRFPANAVQVQHWARLTRCVPSGADCRVAQRP